MIALPRRAAGFCFCTLSILICSCSPEKGTSEPAATKETAPRGVAFQSEPGPADADAPTEFIQTDSGLKYRILRKSDGPKPKTSSAVFVHYMGWLDDGKEFDSSYNDGKPIDFLLTGVIPGWTEGLQLIGKGGMIELEIPPELGYGAEGSPGTIPSNARLHFKIELIEVF
jgi:FKBP-type peptidyl-prolyl cis-trans isomerase FkpA